MEQILNLTKTEIKTLSGILTGHCDLRSHMHRIGKALEDTCRLCMEERETAQHIMCECPAVARITLERFRKGFTSPQTVKSQKAYRVS
jgi:zinc-binding in reverse transcriptase